MLYTGLLLLAGATPSVAPVGPVQREVVVQQYHEFHQTGDSEGLKALWREHEGLVLQTIDADLEGALSAWEGAREDPPWDSIRALQERALFGARCASEALARPIFLDYASSFVGWTDEQKLDFRAGQSLYARAARDLGAGEHETALVAGQETVVRARALGDWWGTAMGYGAQGAAQQALGNLDDALSAYSQARLLNHDLGLRHSEYENLQGMVNCLRALERWQRALPATEALVAYARALRRSREGAERALRQGRDRGRPGFRRAGRQDPRRDCHPAREVGDPSSPGPRWACGRPVPLPIPWEKTRPRWRTSGGEVGSPAQLSAAEMFEPRQEW